VRSTDAFTYSSLALSNISVALFDQRWDGKDERSLLGICLPTAETLLTFSLTRNRDEKKKYETLDIASLSQLPAISIASVRATRDKVWDAIIVKPDGRLTLFTHGLREIPLELESKDRRPDLMDVDGGSASSVAGHQRKMIAIEDATFSSLTLVYNDGSKARVSVDLVPNDVTTTQTFQVLAQTLPAGYCFALHRTFLELWSLRRFSMLKGAEFDCFEGAVARVFDLEDSTSRSVLGANSAWQALSRSPSHDRFSGDSVLARLELPTRVQASTPSRQTDKPHNMLAPILYALHTMGEDMRLSPHRYEDLLRLASLICRIAIVIRPEWADYWKRLCPDAIKEWPSPATTGESDYLATTPDSETDKLYY
jgi:anaphase-promoting complex subunit 1